MKRRRLALVMVLLGLAGLSWFLQNEPPVEPHLVPAVVPGLNAVPLAAEGKDAATDDAPIWLPPKPMKLDDAFCSWTGSDKFELRYSLGRLMEDWLNNHPDGGARDAQANFLFHALTQPQGAQRRRDDPLAAEPHRAAGRSDRRRGGPRAR